MVPYLPSYTPPLERCELCKHYKMIDSGYGHCKRYPPQLILAKLLPLRYKVQYVEVGWCDVACGEFKQKKKE